MLTIHIQRLLCTVIKLHVVKEAIQSSSSLPFITNFNFFVNAKLIGHFTVMDGSEAGVDLVLLQTFLLYYVNQVILMLTSIFQGQFP